MGVGTTVAQVSQVLLHSNIVEVLAAQQQNKISENKGH
jgi:hypothetical protein